MFYIRTNTISSLTFADACIKEKVRRRRWSAEVTEHSDAMTLEDSVFKLRGARAIAESLKHSAQSSERRKGTPFQSAMSMLNFYINRAGKNLTVTRKQTLENAKVELRALFKKED